MTNPTIEELDEFLVWWWGPDTDECTITDAIQDGQMAELVQDALKRWGQPTSEDDCSGGVT